jgi:hypothetical protein
MGTQRVQMKGELRRLNMELDLQSLFGLHGHSCTHWIRPRTAPPSPNHPAFGLDRRHLFVILWDTSLIGWFGWACRSGTRDFCTSLAALVGLLQNKFFLTVNYFNSFVPIAKRLS